MLSQSRRPSARRWPQVGYTPPVRILVLTLASVTLACTSQPQSTPQPRGRAAGRSTPEQRDAAARAAIEQTDHFRLPHCRWLKTGVWIEPYSDERRIYEAAYESGFIEMESPGKFNRLGYAEDALNVKLTDRGREETAGCVGSTSDSWGVPVGYRRVRSVAYAGESFPHSNSHRFEVEYEWELTEIGQKLQPHLTRHMTVQTGTGTASVSMTRTANGWGFQTIGYHDKYQMSPVQPAQ
jgi:hypothetical protein